MVCISSLTTPLLVLAAATTVTIVSAEDKEKHCDASINTEVEASVDNAEYYNSCAEGSTWTVSSVLNVTALSEPDMLKFCQSGKCLEPLHDLLGAIPMDCLVEYHGSWEDMLAEVSEVHDMCHDLLDAAGEHHHGGDNDDDDHDDHDDDGDHHHHGGSSSSSSSDANISILQTGSALAIAAVAIATLIML